MSVPKSTVWTKVVDQLTDQRTDFAIPEVMSLAWLKMFMKFSQFFDQI